MEYLPIIRKLRKQETLRNVGVGSITDQIVGFTADVKINWNPAARDGGADQGEIPPVDNNDAVPYGQKFPGFQRRSRQRAAATSHGLSVLPRSRRVHSDTTAAMVAGPFLATSSTEPPTIALDSITLDDVLNTLEVAGTVRISGSTLHTGAGDVVTLMLNNGVGSSTYLGVINADGAFAIDVPGSVLAADSDRSLEVSVQSAGGSASVSRSFGVDTEAPRVVSATDDVPGTVNSRTGTVTFTLTFSEAVTELTSSDFSLTNGIITRVAPSASGTNSWLVEVSPAPGIASGTISLALAANGAFDAAGNGNTASLSNDQSIDTLAPTIPTITSIVDNVGTITGTVPRGGRTNDTLLVINGTAAANSPVLIFSGDTQQIGTVTSNSGGSWSFTTGTLTNGTTYGFTARATDLAGNQSISDTYTVSVDTVAPGAPKITGVIDDVNPISGRVASGGSTNDLTPTIQGLAEANSSVSVFFGSTRLGSVTAGATGTWEYTTSPLVNGKAYTLNARSTDLAGNQSSASSNYTVTVDTTAPSAPQITSIVDNVGTITGTVAPNGRTNDTTLLLNGKAAARSLVTIFRDGPTPTRIGTATATSKGTWSFTTAPLSNGSTYAFIATATDPAGNLSGYSSSYTVTVDNSAPATPTITSVGDNVGSITGTVPRNGRTNDDTLTLEGTAEANSTVSIFTGTTRIGSVTAGDSGAWTFTTPALTNGTVYNLNARATDAAGNQSNPSINYTVTVDTSAPAAPTITSVVDNVENIIGNVVSGGSTNDTALVLNGRAADFSTVAIFNAGTQLASVTASATGTWTYATAPLSNDTTYSFTATATDAAGNQSTASDAFIVTIDTVTPVVTITSIGGADSIVSGQILDNMVVGTAEANRSVTIRSGSTTLGTVTTTGTGDFSYSLTSTDLSAIGEGPGKSITASQSDPAGNTGASSPVSFAVVPGARILAINDDLAPITGPVANGGRTNDTSPTISGAAPPNSTVSILSNGTLLGSVTANGSGSWSFNTGTLSNATTYGFTATATDAAGNPSVASAPYTITIDTVAPLVTITSIGGVDSIVSDLSLDNMVVGTAEANRSVTIRSGSTTLGTVTATSSGDFAYSLSSTDLSVIGEGPGKSITASQSDRAGNLGLSQPYLFAIAPEAQISDLISLKDSTTIYVSERASVAEITVIRTGSGQNALTLEYTTNEIGSEGAAQPGSDYAPPTLGNRTNTGQLVFDIGETQKIIQIPILNPSIADPESNETFAVGIQNSSTGTLGTLRTVLVTIVDDDAPATMEMTASGITASEDAPMAAITVQRRGDPSAAASVMYTTKDGTAIAGLDYSPSSGVLEFAPGQITKTLMISLLEDDAIESNKSFSVELANPQGADLGSQTASTITILDNDLTLGSLTRQIVVSGLQQPTAIDWTPDGTYMLVAQKDGQVRVVENGILRSTPLVDLSPQVNNMRDRGLLGMAIHPNFPTNPYIYLAYTYDDPQLTAGISGLAGPDGGGNRPSRLVRLDVNPVTMMADPASLKVMAGTNSTWANTSHPEKDSTGDLSILPSGIVNGVTIFANGNLISSGLQDNSPNQIGTQNQNITDYLATDSLSHTIGAVHFGPDGMLYLANGDGTAFNFMDPRGVRVQDINNLSGKLLRIDPISGEGLSDNPFFDLLDPSGNQSKVFYSGFRNPFRFTFDPLTNLPVVGDVGWNTWEEVNTGRPGSNFGWPYLEGPDRTGGYQGLDQAIAFYANGNRNSLGDQAAVFPLLARSHGAPDSANAIMVGDFYNNNTLVFGDINSGRLYAATLDTTSRQVTNVQVFSSGLQALVDMEMGPDQRLYGVQLISGNIYRWDPA